MSKKVWVWAAVILGAILLLGVLFDDGQTQQKRPTDSKKPGSAAYSDSDEQRWAEIIKEDPPTVVSDGWKKPVYLEINRLGWIESQHITSNGQSLYYMFYPGKDLFGTVLQGGPFAGSADIYTSTRESDGQFRTHAPVNKHFMVEGPGASGPAPDEEGNYFYTSERDGDEEDIYLNDRLLPFNREDRRDGNPFYCKAKDELWFDCPLDRKICVLKNAARDDYEGEPTLAPIPINAESSEAHSMQPWLDATCETMYFGSNRDRLGQDFDGPWIYKSKRLGEDEWSKPELVMKANVALGEPTLTRDGKKMYFSQYLIDQNNVNPKTGIGELKAIVLYTERD